MKVETPGRLARLPLLVRFVFVWAIFGVGMVEFESPAAPRADRANSQFEARERSVRATDLAGEAPRIVAPPVAEVAIAGDGLILQVVAEGTPPLAFQWFRGDDELPGQTMSELWVSPVTLSDAGNYWVQISNSAGATNSVPVVVAVLERVPQVIDTGLDASGALLADGSAEIHYQIKLAPAGDTPRAAFVHDSKIAPLVAGPWLANSERSKWIAPLVDSASAPGGVYVYQLKFDLTGFDPATARIVGSWATDNAGLDLRLNGEGQGIINSFQFQRLSPFVISKGFVAGENALEFVVNNAELGATGLRVEGLRLGALRPASEPPLSIMVNEDHVILAWPVSSPGFNLVAKTDLNGPRWTPVTAPIVQAGDQFVVTLLVLESSQCYRLEQ